MFEVVTAIAVVAVMAAIYLGYDNVALRRRMAAMLHLACEACRHPRHIDDVCVCGCDRDVCVNCEWIASGYETGCIRCGRGT